LIFGVLLIVYCLNRAALTYQSREWTAVPGEVLYSYVTIGGKHNGLADLNVAYNYRVNGVNYVGKTITYGYRGFFFSENREKIEAKLAQYPRGAIVQVYYKTSSPAYSCLEAGGNLWGFIFPISGGILLIVFGAWRTIKQKNKGV
jgi:hypothetical protein